MTGKTDKSHVCTLMTGQINDSPVPTLITCKTIKVVSIPLHSHHHLIGLYSPVAATAVPCTPIHPKRCIQYQYHVDQTGHSFLHMMQIGYYWAISLYTTAQYSYNVS